MNLNSEKCPTTPRPTYEAAPNIHLRLPLDLLIRGQHRYVRRPLYARSSRKSADNYVEIYLDISGQVEGVLLSLQP
jgi:hypothetical protein